MQARVLTLHAGLPQLAAWLAEKPAGSVSELHLLCHGRSGGLLLGGQWLTLDNLAAHTDSLRQLGRALAAEADWRVYGCEVAQGARGRRFVAALARLSGFSLPHPRQLARAMAGRWMCSLANPAASGFRPG